MREGWGRWSLKLIAWGEMQRQRNPDTVKETEIETRNDGDRDGTTEKKRKEMREKGKQTRKGNQRKMHREQRCKWKWTQGEEG